MGFFDKIGGFFSDAYHTVAGGVTDAYHAVAGGAETVYNGAKDVVNTAWSGGKDVVSDVYGGVKSGINRAADFAEKAGDKSLDAFAGMSKIFSNPILVGGGIILALVIFSKV